jgi:uncharacterized membrane protein
LFSLFASVVFDARPSKAWFQVCNQSQQIAFVAFAFLDIEDSRHSGYRSTSEIAVMPRTTGWIARGWTRLEPGSCRQTYEHELTKRNRYYYVFAKSPSGAVWSGNNGHCVDPVNGFTFQQYRDGSCSGEWVKFIEVDTNGARNFTFNLR